MAENINHRFAREIMLANPHTAEILLGLTSALERIIRAEQSNMVEFIHQDVINIAEEALRKTRGE